MKRERLAKAIYDMAKVAFGGLVIAPFVEHHATLAGAILGILGTVLLLVLAWLLDKEKTE